LRGIVFQADGADPISAWFIRPMARLDRRVAGLHDPDVAEPLASHAGIHVVVEDGSELVAENLSGTAYENLTNAVNWTPIADFAARDQGGWHVTIPATCFRDVDDVVVQRVVGRLNRVDGEPFVRENCVAFIERVFAQHMFIGSPTLHALGVNLHVPDPALPRLRADADLDQRADWLLRAQAVRTRWVSNEALDTRLRVYRALAAGGLGIVAALSFMGLRQFRRRRVQVARSTISAAARR
jgi:hypothetical protein